MERRERGEKQARANNNTHIFKVGEHIGVSAKEAKGLLHVLFVEQLLGGQIAFLPDAQKRALGSVLHPSTHAKHGEGALRGIERVCAVRHQRGAMELLALYPVAHIALGHVEAVANDGRVNAVILHTHHLRTENNIHHPTTRTLRHSSSMPPRLKRFHEKPVAPLPRCTT